MLIPAFAINQSEDCQTVFFSQSQCYYDATTCPCGWGGINPNKFDITQGTVTITLPNGQVITVAKNFLPTIPGAIPITCTDLSISTTTPVPSPPINECGCGTVTTTTTTTNPATCWQDGCYTFQYDVYATETVVTYNWNLSSIFSNEPYPGYCVSITIDGNIYTSETYLSDETAILNWLNTLSLGYFTLNSTTHVISVTSFSHVYANLTTNTAQTLYTFLFESCSLFDFPDTLETISINGSTFTVNVSVASWDDVVTEINNLGLGTFTSGGFFANEGSIFASSCTAKTLEGLTFAGCDPGIESDTPTTFTFTPTTSSVSEQTLVGTATKEVFLDCNVRNGIKNFKLSQFAADCNCISDIQERMCELDSNFATMQIAAHGTGSCDCRCSTAYLNKLQNQLNSLQQLCP